MCAHGRKSGAVLLDDKVAILVDGAFYRRRAYHLFGALWRDVLLDCDVCRAANNDMGCEDQRTMELQARVKKLVETGGLQ